MSTATGRSSTLVSVLLVCAAGIVACGGDARDDRRDRPHVATMPESARLVLTGVGATLPYPLYARWFNEYATVAPVRIVYRSEGSPQGITAMLEGTADFGATDVPVPDSVMRRTDVALLHVPMAVGAVAITYNLPGVTKPLRLSGAVLADLFEGRTTAWDDPRIAAENPGVILPALPVRPVMRSDGSGTASIFDGYLRTVRGDSGAARTRPVGAIVRDGNEAVAAEVKATEGSIAYLEVVYARQNRLPVAHLRNKAGRFVSPTPFEIATAAANTLEGLAPLSDEGASGFRVSLLDADGREAYPLASFTWLLLRPDRMSAEKRRATADFLHWAFELGAPAASAMGYVPLPSAVAEQVLDRVDAALRCDPCAPGARTGTVR